VPAFPANARVVDVDVGGMTVDEAEAVLHEELNFLTQPLVFRAGATTATLAIEPSDVELELSLDAMRDEALQRAEESETLTMTHEVTVSLQAQFDRAALRERLVDFAHQTALSPTITLITDTETISRSFAYIPARAIDVEEAVSKAEQGLLMPRASQPVTLELHPLADSPPMQASLEQIGQQVGMMADEWNGVVGFYLYDMQSGEVVSLNEDTVFSGASVMKAAILLNAYAHLPEFTEKQEFWIRRMIVESDNLSANHVLAAAAGGLGTEDALVGAELMNEMLRDMGLEHTYQYMPYEASDYLINVRGMEIKRGPPQEGSPPYTEADPMLRTTPREMSQVFLWLDECSRGEGELVATYTETLTIDRCQEMLDLLAQNADDSRMCAGIPSDVRVEHKSGWIQDMQSDIGIVRSPGGDFLLAIYLYQKTDMLYDPVATPVIAAFARMVYTGYNPLVVGEYQ
jgi:beta-lactamase class A